MHFRPRILAAVSILTLAACGRQSGLHPNSQVGETREELVYGVSVVFSETAHLMPLQYESAAPVFPIVGDGSEDAFPIPPDGSLSVEEQESNDDSSTTAAAGLPHLLYYGGPVMPNVKVVTIFWGANVNNQAALNRFYSTITNSPYIDWLRQYSTRTQAIGRGRLSASYVDRNHPPGASITNQQIQAELNRLIAARAVPANDGNTLYMVHFPAGISISMGTSRSCVQFCAYHSTFQRAGSNVYYGVMPDLSGACARGCGPNTYFNNTTSTSSHELIESITDPAVGLATRLGPPLAWYDSRYGEIADICNQNQTVVAGFTVQRGWSNAGNFCRAQ